MLMSSLSSAYDLYVSDVIVQTILLLSVCAYFAVVITRLHIALFMNDFEARIGLLGDVRIVIDGLKCIWGVESPVIAVSVFPNVDRIICG